MLSALVSQWSKSEFKSGQSYPGSRNGHLVPSGVGEGAMAGHDADYVTLQCVKWSRKIWLFLWHDRTIFNIFYLDTVRQTSNFA